ncbi:Hsp20/alpha crystallin family protein [Streptomyces hoynatensis]|uniref:Hsp20/alpha crystallin family protein n=1 Tax=Streptomyces hoynatensis TaxID=1141874 RepID=A0A3A9YZJ0_9ACTN|nr:Hsp20/alpha crystallin family protein [Streptomyces hoynatensis]RKN41602.1 Hsp20/alpha crystallin family protein [Streptomyces hoynatensis]
MTLPLRRHRPLVDGRRGYGRDPLSEFDDLFERMGSLLSSVAPATGFGPEGGWAPFADLTETDGEFVIECEVPGIRREDIDIQLSERELTIGGETREAEREGKLHRGTRRTGRFEYRTVLPGQPAVEGVSATLEEGVLTVRIPKADTASVRHIEIQEEGGKG